MIMWRRQHEQTSIPLTHEGSTWNLDLTGQVVLEKKIFENGGWTDGGRTDGPWLYYKLTNEPKGSGELKNPEAHGPQWLTKVNSYKSLIHHSSF